MSKDPCAG